jgi:hypothetical protein
MENTIELNIGTLYYLYGNNEISESVLEETEAYILTNQINFHRYLTIN